MCPGAMSALNRSTPKYEATGILPGHQRFCGEAPCAPPCVLSARAHGVWSQSGPKFGAWKEVLEGMKLDNSTVEMLPLVRLTPAVVRHAHRTPAVIRVSG